MDYKKIIRSRSTRVAILRFLRFVPDKTMLKLQYRIKTGRKLDLRNPKRFTEKLQWYKLYYRDPEMIRCVDKYEVREYVRACGLESLLNECYGVYDLSADVDFSELPDKFVLKDTLGGGGNSVILIEDKSQIDEEKLRTQMENWIKKPLVRGGGREWPYYSGKKHRIIAERYIESDEAQGGLIDYKFFCFDGKPTYVYVIADRALSKACGLGIYDADFNELSVLRADEQPLQRRMEKPGNYEELYDVAAKLSEKFPHARVDLYNQGGKIVFGEITFFDGSGYMKFNPDSFDEILGSEFLLRKYQ